MLNGVVARVHRDTVSEAVKVLGAVEIEGAKLCLALTLSTSSAQDFNGFLRFWPTSFALRALSSGPVVASAEEKTVR